MEKRTEEERVTDALKKLEKLKLIRANYESAIDECIEFTAPDLLQITEEDTKGQKTGETVYDGTAVSALNLLADGLHGYLVSPAIRWFSLSLPIKLQTMRSSANMRQNNGKRLDEMDEVKQWLEDVEEVMYQDFRVSNFYEVTPQVFRQGGAIGTTTCFCEHDVRTGRIVFFSPHFRECFIAQDRFGRVDTVYRKYKLTNREIGKKFGMEAVIKCDPDFENAFNNKPYDERAIIHAIFPRSDYDPEKIDNLNMPWASMWMFEAGQKKLVNESGFQWNPSTTWRWSTNSNEWYGRSPAWFAMVDILKAQQQALTNLRAGHRAADPPYALMESLRGRANLNAGGRTYIGKGEEIPQILDGGLRGIPIGIEFQQATEQAIKEHFHVDFFLMLSRAAFEKVNMTATQVIEMQGEKAAILGTRIGRLQSEFLNPVIDQVFSIEAMAGRLPPPPDILYEYAGQTLEVDYMGPLAQAQKRLFKTQSIAAALESLVPLVQVAPEALDNIDIDATAKEILESHGMPAKCIRDEKDLIALRQARAEQMQAQQVNEGMIGLSKALPGLSKAPEPGSPMDGLKQMVGK